MSGMPTFFPCAMYVLTGTFNLIIAVEAENFKMNTTLVTLHHIRKEKDR